ncbi:MAG TPA: DNA polymerase III subunit delta' [Rhodanobacter sp.]|nr:DNA polymerase III subunit delta' [Rhodanobacter sp.]
MTALPWHAEDWARLQARRARDALPHALLLCGAAGLGKRGFAQRFMRGLLCARPVGGEACGQCRSCLLLAAGTHPDLVELTFGLRKDGMPRSEIVVDQIRGLSARLALNSQFGGWQIACIDPADAMNPAAANGLLKTLEEPSARTLLLLLADAPWRLPQTIRSRCQRIEFHLPPADQALAWLGAQGVADGALALSAAGGNPGLARDWFRDGTLARRGEVRKDLAALAAGRGEPVAVVKRWLESEPAQRLWFAAQAVADERAARVAGHTPPLGSALDGEGLERWYAAANRTREHLRGPLRQDLLVLELLARWR